MILSFLCVLIHLVAAPKDIRITLPLDNLTVTVSSPTGSITDGERFTMF
jgi:hypothetical protein